MRGFYRGRRGWGGYGRRPVFRLRPFLHGRAGWHIRPLYWGLGLLFFPGLCLASMFLLPFFRLLAR
jgi:hypothetical protein